MEANDRAEEVKHEMERGTYTYSYGNSFTFDRYSQRCPEHHRPGLLGPLEPHSFVCSRRASSFFVPTGPADADDGSVTTKQS